MGTKKKMKQISVKDFEKAFNGLEKLLVKNEIPFYMLASHPENGSFLIASGGSQNQLIIMSQEIEIDAKQILCEAASEDPSIVPDLAETLRECDEHYGKKRTELREKLSAVLAAQKKEPQTPEDLDPSDPVSFFEGLAKMAKGPNSKIQIMGFSTKDQKDPSSVIGDLLRSVSGKNQADQVN